MLASDRIRREIMNDDADRYSPERRLAVYDEMIARARPIIGAARPVLLDAAFLRGEERDRAAALAASAGIPLIVVETVCDPKVADARVAARANAGGSVSDADLAVLLAQRTAFAADPPPLPAGATHVTIDTSADGPWAIDDLLAALDAAGLRMPIAG